jgi:excisionase family DNA binding protein
MTQNSANNNGQLLDTLPDSLCEQFARTEKVTFPFEPLLDDERAAEFLGGIHPKTLQRMARRGEVPAYRVGRFWRYRASELDSWLRVKSNGRIARVVSMKEKP